MAFPQLQTTNLDTLISTTLQAYLPQMEINVITSVPLVRYLLDENARRVQGGTRINIQLLYGYNSTTTWFNQSDYIDVSPQEAVTAAQYKWANLVGAVTVFGEEEAANSNDAMLQDFVQAKITQLELSLARQLNQAAYGDGTGFFGAAPDGLANLVFSTATPADPAGGAVGGISAVTFPFWRNNANLSPGTYAANGSMGTANSDFQLRMFHLTTDGALRPTFIISDNSVFESYQFNAGVHYRATETKDMDLGFEHINYKGVPWVWDRDCPAGVQYFINSKFLYSVVDPNRFFRPTDWMPTITQDGKVLRLHLRMNNVCSNRMLQGVIGQPGVSANSWS